VRADTIISGVRAVFEGEVSKAGFDVIILNRGKGKNAMLVERREIHTLEEIPRPFTPTRILVRNLASVDEDGVRQHLADRHGVPLRGISPLPELAMQDHNIMHRNHELGHTHDGSRGVTQNGRPSEEEVAERAAALDKEYEDALECDSCGYVRRPEEDGRMMHTLQGRRKMHCQECHDPEEYLYE
jgi:hypothetical protein